MIEVSLFSFMSKLIEPLFNMFGSHLLENLGDRLNCIVDASEVKINPKDLLEFPSVEEI